jgi:hypothetical protein
MNISKFNKFRVKFQENIDFNNDVKLMYKMLF